MSLTNLEQEKIYQGSFTIKVKDSSAMQYISSDLFRTSLENELRTEYPRIMISYHEKSDLQVVFYFSYSDKKVRKSDVQTSVKRVLES